MRFGLDYRDGRVLTFTPVYVFKIRSHFNIAGIKSIDVVPRK